MYLDIHIIYVLICIYVYIYIYINSPVVYHTNTSHTPGPTIFTCFEASQLARRKSPTESRSLGGCYPWMEGPLNSSTPWEEGGTLGMSGHIHLIFGGFLLGISDFYPFKKRVVVWGLNSYRGIIPKVRAFFL